MKFFLDTANVEEIRTVQRWGILDGVTTNPTLVARERMDYRAVVREIASITSGPISVETTSDKAEEMIAQGKVYATWAPNVVVKVPATTDGVMAAAALTREGIRINMTLTFSANQALLAAKVGAYFVSPFVGRLDDIGHDGMQVVRDAVQIFRTYGFTTQVLASSVRHPLHVTQAALAGAHIATMPFKVAEQLSKHPLTEQGQERFLTDWRKLQSELEQRKAKV
jgi:transaldolase